MKKLLIVDGNSILNRAYYGIRPLTNKDGLFTHAVYGMANILLRQLEQLRPDYAVVAFDVKAPTFRHKAYEGYKATRHGMPPELAVQLPYAKDMCRSLGFHVAELPGYEADDILGTAAETAKGDGIESYILTGDRDSLQLIDDCVTVLLATNAGEVAFDRAHFREEYGIDPEQFIFVKALMGDKSDNIPGVTGVGDKTALKLISDFGSLDALYAALDSGELPEGAAMPTKGVVSKLTADRDKAYESLFLVTIDRHAPLSFSLSDAENKGFTAELYPLCVTLEFSSMIKKLGLCEESDPIAEAVGLPLSIVSPEELKSTALGHTVAVNFGDNVLFVCDGEKHLCALYENAEDVRAQLRSFAEKTLIVYSSKELWNFLGGDLDCHIFDTVLAAYLLSPTDSAYPVDALCTRYLATTPAPLTVDSAALSGITAFGAQPLYDLMQPLSDAMEEQQLTALYRHIELPTAKVLSAMERCGFKVDVAGLQEFAKQLDVMTSLLAAEIYEMAGRDFNINSPKQLGEVLFEGLELPVFKKKKSGYSTDAETLEKLRPYHPIIDRILEYRQVTKLNATYAKGLSEVADENHYIHTTFHQTVTATGRLSSTEPNLQNIPIRQPLGRELRRFFLPKSSDYVLVDADYSQIELRLLAHIANDTTMIDAFKNGVDIHAVTASQVYHTPLDEVTSAQRKNAKAVNFGIVYGISDFSLSGDLKISRAEAARYIESYFATYPGVKKYMDEAVADAKDTGYAVTMFGRRRYIPELSSQKIMLKKFGERVAMNSPIQGSAADIIKIAMIRVSEALAAANIDAHLILQVHDELIVEAKRDCADEAAAILRREMENAASLSVPLTVDINIGDTWFDS